MHPILFESDSLTVYTYGFCRAVGAVLGFVYLARQGKKQFGLTFDAANTLFLLLVAAGLVGGKLLYFIVSPEKYTNGLNAISGDGFVFFGSLLLCVPIMWWFFKRQKLPVWGMLDVMAVVICIVHVCGRIGCFLAGCCHGHPTDSLFGVTFTDPACQAYPLNTPLHPTQLYEAAWVFLILILLVVLKGRAQFQGQLFLLYLVTYSIGRFGLEYFRGDAERGFVINNYLTTSQFISILVAVAAGYFYLKRRRVTLVSS